MYFQVAAGKGYGRKMSTARFGPGGNSESFYASGHKETAQAPRYVKEFGLDLYEYQGGKGLHASGATYARIGEEAKKSEIKMSLHAPYFISLSSLEEEKRDNSLRYIKKSIDAAALLGAEKIVVHPGAAAKRDRNEAVRLAAETLDRVARMMEDNGTVSKLALETMGKINQLGTLEEIIFFCGISDYFVPCVDFGHINAREHGFFDDKDKYKYIFDTIGDKLGDEYARTLHCHFSKIEYSAGGEKKHLRFDDKVFGPDYEPLMEVIADFGLSPTIICESAGTMTEDAMMMKRYYNDYKRAAK